MTIAEQGTDLDRVLFEDAPVGLAFLDRDLRYLRINRELAAINGLPVEAHLGRSVEELWPDLDPRVFAGLRAVLQTGAPVERLELEAETPAAPGEMRAFVHAYRAVRSASGAIIGINCSVVETTERRRAEAEARRARTAARLIADLNGRLAAAASVADVAGHVVDLTARAFGAITSGLFLLEPDGTMRTVGATGYSDEILAGFGAWPYDLPSPGASAMRAGEVMVWPTLELVEEAFPEIGGAMRHVTGERAIASAPLLIEGQPIGVIHVGFEHPRELSPSEVEDLRAIADVTALAIRRIRLVESERRGRRILEATVDQAPVGVVVAGAGGEILLINAESRRIWGGDPQAKTIHDRTEYRAFHHDGRPYEPLDWPLARSLLAGEVVTDEDIEIETFDGRRRIIEDASAPVRDDDGRIIGAVVVFTDVTEKREDSALRDAFIGMLSHELRTPITAIYGVANLLEARGETMERPVRLELIGDIRAEADRLFRLVENLLVLARAERHATTIDPAPVLVHRLLPRIVQTESTVWPALRLWLSGPEVVPPVRADEGFVELIVRNLISNAAKYAPGPVEVRFWEEGDEVRVEVCDSGPGIPESEVEHIFELFRRVRRAGAEHVPGSGIGLFVVRHLAEAMGGRAWARNRPEGGAAVGISLPIDPEAM